MVVQQTLQDEEFEFILKDKNGKEVQRIKNVNADGTGRVVFQSYSIYKAGELSELPLLKQNAGETEMVSPMMVESTCNCTRVDNGKVNWLHELMYYPKFLK